MPVCNARVPGVPANPGGIDYALARQPGAEFGILSAVHTLDRNTIDIVTAGLTCLQKTSDISFDNRHDNKKSNTALFDSMKHFHQL